MRTQPPAHVIIREVIRIFAAAPIVPTRALMPWDLASSASTCDQTARQVVCSSAGSLASAAGSRIPARSVSAFQCWSVCVIACRAAEAAVQDLGPGRQVGREPVPRLFSPANLRRASSGGSSFPCPHPAKPRRRLRYSGSVPACRRPALVEPRKPRTRGGPMRRGVS